MTQASRKARLLKTKVNDRRAELLKAKAEYIQLEYMRGVAYDYSLDYGTERYDEMNRKMEALVEKWGPVVIPRR